MGAVSTGSKRVIDMTKARKLVINVRALTGALLIAALGTACTHVAPYERGILAHPTMSTDDPSIGLDEHVRAVSEGAAGGVGGGGGGCGCN